MNEQTTDKTGEKMVKEMIRQWLSEHGGYDGLRGNDAGWECGCGVDDLAPCGDPFPFGCVPAMKGPDGLFYPKDYNEKIAGAKDWKETPLGKTITSGRKDMEHERAINIAENALKHDIANDDLFDFAAQLVRAMEAEMNIEKEEA